MSLKLFNIISIFPDLIHGYLKEGLVGQAFKKNIAQIEVVNPRDFTQDFHRTIDDRPFGGGDGMVFMAEPLTAALTSLEARKGLVVHLSPQGRLWNDHLAREWAKSGDPVTLICGRYGGIDQRFVEMSVDLEISIGDYVLSGGELGALVIVDSVVRLLPEVLGNPESAEAETFAQGLLECPLLTRPREFMGWEAPEVLLSGHHERIQQFRQDVALVRTFLKRPDLLAQSARVQEIPLAIRRLSSIPESQLKSMGMGVEILKRCHEMLKEA